MQVSTRSLVFTAWTAATIFGRNIEPRGHDDNYDEPTLCASPDACRDHGTDLDRFKRVAKQFALTETQQEEIDLAISRHQPLIDRLRTKLRQKQQAMAALHPASDGFLHNTARFSNDIGALATHLSLESKRLQTAVFTILTDEQRALLDELQDAFRQRECDQRESRESGIDSNHYHRAFLDNRDHIVG